MCEYADPYELRRGRPFPTCAWAASRPVHSFIAIWLVECNSAVDIGWGICRDKMSGRAQRDALVQLFSYLDHDVGRYVSTVGGVNVPREAGGIAIRAYVDVLTDGAMESGSYDFLHAAAAARGQRAARISRGKNLTVRSALQYGSLLCPTERKLLSKGTMGCTTSETHKFPP